MYAKIQNARYEKKVAAATADANGYSNAPVAFDPFDQHKSRNRGLKPHEIARLQAQELRQKIQTNRAAAATMPNTLAAAHRAAAEQKRAAEQAARDAERAAEAAELRRTIGFPVKRVAPTAPPSNQSSTETLPTVVDCWDD